MQTRIIITRFPYESVFSGEEVHTLELAKQLQTKGFQIQFIGSCQILKKEFQKLNFKSNYYWGGISLVSLFAFLLFLITFPFVILSFFLLALWIKFNKQADLVYMLSLNEKLFLTPFLKLLKIKVIWVEHSRIGNWLEKNPLLFLYQQWSKTTPIISVSQNTNQKLIKLGIPSKQIHYITNGIDLEQFKKIESSKIKNWQIKHKIDNSKTTIGLITRLFPDKGIQYFIEAFQTIHKDFPQLQALIIGEGPDKEILKKQSKNLPIHFLGKIPHQEIPLFLKSISIFILPSSEIDPFGLAPAEAMAAEKPVIVTNLCGIADFIENGKNGLIIPAKNAPAIAEALFKILSNPKFAQKITQNGKKLATTKFSLKTMVQEYLKVFQKA